MLYLQAARFQGRLARVAACAPDRGTRLACDRRCRIGTFLDLSLNGTDSPHPLPEFLLGVAVGFPDRPTGFAQVVEWA